MMAKRKLKRVWVSRNYNRDGLCFWENKPRILEGLGAYHAVGSQIGFMSLRVAKFFLKDIPEPGKCFELE